MEITKDTLQELINKRADKKATDEINQLVQIIHKSGLLDLKQFTITGPDHKNSLRSSLWSLSKSDINTPLYKLYHMLYIKYVEKETISFVEKVESLVSQADNLLNISENFNQNYNENY